MEPHGLRVAGPRSIRRLAACRRLSLPSVASSATVDREAARMNAVPAGENNGALLAEPGLNESRKSSEILPGPRRLTGPGGSSLGESAEFSPPSGWTSG